MSFMSAAVDTGVATSAKNHWHDLEQAFIDDNWYNTTQHADGLLEQPYIGAPLNLETWISNDAQHSPALDITSNINFYRTEDQAVHLLFRNIDKTLINGIYYYWRENFWLSYYEYDNTTYQSYCLAVRCDNELKFKDEYGNIKSWPCRVDSQATANKYKETDYIITPNNNYIVYVQRNSETEKYFRINRRFLLGGGGENDNLRPFKVIGLMNSHKGSIRNERGNNSAGILYLLMQLDEIDYRDGTDPSVTTTTTDKESYGIAFNADVNKAESEQGEYHPNFNIDFDQIPPKTPFDFHINSYTDPSGKIHEHGFRTEVTAIYPAKDERGKDVYLTVETNFNQEVNWWRLTGWKIDPIEDPDSDQRLPYINNMHWGSVHIVVKEYPSNTVLFTYDKDIKIRW